MPRLIANHISKRFGRRLLFREMSLSLVDGEALAITGANGSGKSTLLQILAGVLTPTSGSVELSIRDREVTRERHPLHVGLVAPYLNVYDGFSPRENLSFIAKARRLANAGPRIAGALEFVSLTDRADDLVGTFSSGTKQRVKFAAAILAEPEVLLLDEPRVNLD
ncbi:MAG: ABC transporter ATP-binding protein, partial [Rhodothermales bacterium]